VIAGGYTATNSLRCADRPILLESLGTVDAGCVRPGGCVDVVCASIALDRALELSTRAGVVGAKASCVSIGLHLG
jgi:hypothetical protein